MQIPSLFSAVPAVLNSGLRLIGVDIEGKIGRSAPQETGVGDKAQPPFDLTSITPDEFSELIDRLRAGGQLSAEHYRELLGVRLELDQARAPHDQPVDVPGMLQAKLARMQGLGGGPSEADQTKRQLQLLNSLATARGIDALA